MKTSVDYRLAIFVFVSTFSLSAAAQSQDINEFINQWHKAATNADFKGFFSSMSDSSIFIGTDKGERWNKSAFMNFAKPHFDKGKAWDFKPYDRDIHLSANGQYVWFSELLLTWMGVCRGSGVLHKSTDGWKIDQYHLSVTVPNEVIKDFIALVDNFNKQQK